VSRVHDERAALLRGIRNALLIVGVLYVGIALAMLVVGSWRGW
jgi:hypothetical protein